MSRRNPKVLVSPTDSRRSVDPIEDTATRLLRRVKELRLGLGLTQVTFARQAGLTYKYYQAIEAGRKKDLRLSTLEKLAEACELPLWQLLDLDGESGAPC